MYIVYMYMYIMCSNHNHWTTGLDWTRLDWTGDIETRVPGSTILFFFLFLFTPQLAGEARQLECPKIVLDHVRVYIYIYIFIYVCAHHNA